jgi:exonuclease SbcC
VRLNSLRLLNFRQHAETFMVFDAGITGIIGANGSGKTTVLEAIAWALYGNAAARGTRDSIRHARAGARAPVRVELDFELAGHRYRVVRGLTSAELYLDGATQPIANSITAVTDLLQRRLGMTRNEFFNTYFTGQKELNVMAAMGPTERAQFLSRVLGYEKLRTAQGLARDRRRLIGAEVQGLAGGMPDAESVRRALDEAGRRLKEAEVRAAEAVKLRNEAEKERDALAPQWKAAQVDLERIRQLESESRVLDGELAAARRDEQRLRAELQEAQQAVARNQELGATLAPLAGLRAELARLDVMAREEGRRQTLELTIAQALEDEQRLRERQKKLEGAPDLERETQEQIGAAREALAQAEAAAEEQRTAWVRDRQEAETRRDSLLRQWRELKDQRDQVARLGPESPCPTCTRPLGDNLAGVLEMLDEQLDTVLVDGGYYKDRLQQLSATPQQVSDAEELRRTRASELQHLERRLAKIQSALNELTQVRADLAERETRITRLRAELAALPTGYDTSRHAHTRAEVERLSLLEQESNRLGVLADRAPRLATELAAIGERLAAATKRQQELAAERAAIQLDEVRFNELRVRMEAAEAAVRNAEIASVQAEGELGSARKALESAERDKRELERIQERLNALKVERKLHEELDRSFTDLRTDLNFQLRPELSEIASGFLSELTDSRYAELELDDQYNVVVLEDGVPKPVISGGEEDLANLVLRLAISQLIAERAGQNFSLLVLDEVFGSLDEARRLNVVELLRRIQDRFEQIVLITHIESVREGVDRVVEVRYDEETGSSVVHQADADEDLVMAGAVVEEALDFGRAGALGE